MRYRRPCTAQGQYVAALLTTQGDEFDVPAETHAAEISLALGQPVTIVEGDADPWDGGSALLAVPASPPAPPPPLVAFTQAEVAALPASVGALGAAKAILAKPDADITAAEVKSLVLLMARYLLRKWIVEGWR